MKLCEFLTLLVCIVLFILIIIAVAVFMVFHRTDQQYTTQAPRSTKPMTVSPESTKPMTVSPGSPTPITVSPTTSKIPTTTRISLSHEINIWIFTTNDNLVTVKLKMKESDKIRQIKELISKQKSIPIEQMNLSSLGQKLDDDLTIKDYNIRKGSIIDLLAF